MVFFSDEVNQAEDQAKDPSNMILRLHVSYFVNERDDFGGFVSTMEGRTTPLSSVS